MHLTKKQVEEARNVYDLYRDSYLDGDVETFGMIVLKLNSHQKQSKPKKFSSLY